MLSSFTEGHHQLWAFFERVYVTRGILREVGVGGEVGREEVVLRIWPGKVNTLIVFQAQPNSILKGLRAKLWNQPDWRQHRGGSLIPLCQACPPAPPSQLQAAPGIPQPGQLPPRKGRSGLIIPVYPMESCLVAFLEGGHETDPTITKGGRRGTAPALEPGREMEPTPRTQREADADNPAWQLEAGAGAQGWAGRVGRSRRLPEGVSG